MKDVSQLLAELLPLACMNAWSEGQTSAAAIRVAQAYESPDEYLGQHPDEVWVLEGYESDLEERKWRLLAWAFFDCVFDLLSSSDHVDDLARQIFAKCKFTSGERKLVLDTAYSKRTLDSTLRALNHVLATRDSAAAPTQLLMLDDGFSDELHLLEVRCSDVETIEYLASELRLRISKMTR